MQRSNECGKCWIGHRGVIQGSCPTKDVRYRLDFEGIMSTNGGRQRLNINNCIIVPSVISIKLMR